ncbi:MAG TPA: hypothetical protein VGQ34_07250 [Sphingomicrobium sp.]|nr:hypothetical protein [Sphingomicrobium sp.]
MRMRGKDLILKSGMVAAAILVSSCDTIPGEPEHIIGIWGGPHAGLEVQGGLADVQFDCASGTIDDPLYPAADGTFAVKGTYRTGAPGPIKVGEYFRSQSAIYSGQVAKAATKTGPRLMTFRVALDDGTTLGPFTVQQGMPPQLTRCA